MVLPRSRTLLHVLTLADAPSVADWMQGWGTLLALPLSMIALILTARLLRQEMRNRREDREQEEASQASLVCLTSMMTASDGTNITEFLPTIVNNSNSPVFDVQLNVWLLGVPVCLATVTERLEPGGYTEFPIEMKRPLSDADHVSWSHREGALIDERTEITFMDSCGRTWKRYRKNPPQRLPKGPINFDYQPLHTLLPEYLYVNHARRALRKLGNRLSGHIERRLVRRLPLAARLGRLRGSYESPFSGNEYRQVRRVLHSVDAVEEAGASARQS